MDQNKNYKTKYPIYKRIKYHFTSQEKIEAHLLDYMQEHPELTPAPPEPPRGEFQKIMSEMDKRGTQTVVGRQLRMIRLGHHIGGCIHKPIVLILVILAVLGVSMAGIAAGKTHDGRVRARVSGKTELVWNNDQYAEVYESPASGCAAVRF